MSTNITLQFWSFLILVIILCSPIVAYAEEPLVFSAPPRETLAKGKKTYEPIALFLSKKLKRKVIYEHPGNWLSYSADMRKGKYDIIFDGPHFVSWRIRQLEHVPLIKIPGDFYFLFLTRIDNNKINKVSDLVGKKVCGHAPPNQGTLRLYNQLENPARQPILVQVKGWRNIFKATMEGRCEAGIVPSKIYNKMDPDRKLSKVIFESKHVSGQAITAGNAFTHNQIIQLQDLLLSHEGYEATKNLRERFASDTLLKANRGEYDGVYKLLRFSYGFNMN
jgi:ABC-type phosphate/phosphonate transport system substrate-binding protein